MINALNLKVFKLSDNCVSFTRNMLNELLVLEHLEDISLDNNPIDAGGIQEEELYSIVAKRLPQLR